VNIGFILHLYQPPTQTEHVFKQICVESYIPLLKLIKSKPNYKFTLNVPLSLLEQMDKYGYKDWLKDLRDLYESERVEIVGCSAYHSLLTKTPVKLAEQGIILNEFGLGYYLGSRQGFEGEESILVKNLRGFFPPELCVNDEVIALVSSLGYDWLIADRCVVPQDQTLMLGQNIYKYKDYSSVLVVRDCDISNLISFKRDSISDEIIEKIFKRSETTDSIVISLDAEAFGHHNKEGIFLLEDIADKLLRTGYSLTTISELVSDSPREQTAEVFESNWSQVSCSKDSDNLYKLWADPDNNSQKSLWYIQENILKHYEKISEFTTPEGFENIAIWNSLEMQSLPKDTREKVELMLLVQKSLHSDQFWWASGATILDKVLLSPTMINNALNYYKEISARLGDSDLIFLVDTKSREIQDSLTPDK
jgi:alpha-amylase/alpha-mannosidase (GH57 family)